MRDNDIIEKIHKVYDQKEPDVLSRLDFSKVEMKSAPEKNINKRYVSAVAVYAAACLVVAIALPFIIGGRGDDPKPQPGVSMTNTETVATGDDTRDDMRLAESDSEKETKADETTDRAENAVTPTESSNNESTSEPETATTDVSEPETAKNPYKAEPAVSTTKKPAVSEAVTEATASETEKKPSNAEHAVSTSKKPVTTPAPTVTDPVTPEPDTGVDTPIFINPPATPDPKATTASTLRFYKDSGHTEEYESAADIPYGAVVYYEVVSDPGYLCTRIKMNVYEIKIASRPHDFPQSDNCFVNTYSGNGLEYSTYSVLAGDMDSNLVYNLKDVLILLKFLVNGYGVAGVDGTHGDYNCDGRVNMTDVSGVLQEVAKWNTDRNNPCPNTFELEYLLPIDNAYISDVLFDYDERYWRYIVVNDTVDAARYDFPQELIEKYDDSFYEAYSLVIFNVYFDNGNTPTLTELWYNTTYNIVEPVWEKLSVDRGENYALCIPVEKSLGVTEDNPR